MSVPAFEIQRFPSDWVKTAATSRFLVGGLFLGEATTKAHIGLAALNVAGFAAGQVLGQPDDPAEDGPTIFKIAAASTAGSPLGAAELQAALTDLAEVGESSDQASVLSAKKIPWLKLAMALFELWKQFGGDEG